VCGLHHTLLVFRFGFAVGNHTHARFVSVDKVAADPVGVNKIGKDVNFEMRLYPLIKLLDHFAE